MGIFKKKQNRPVRFQNVETSLNHLDSSKRQLFLMSMKGMASQEIANKLQLPQQTVDLYLQEAKSDLRNHFSV
ncbi:MAG: sigma-70 region 4 domain-containing protein [Saprospiraceae bacterium]|nr:sigma-70 region 4 domain-containing protein [Saprospiraceae bacterium]